MTQPQFKYEAPERFGESLTTARPWNSTALEAVERLNGRAAMVGFIAALIGELISGRDDARAKRKAPKSPRRPLWQTKISGEAWGWSQGSATECVVTRFEARGLKEPLGLWRCVAGGPFETWRCGLRPWGSRIFKAPPGHTG